MGAYPPSLGNHVTIVKYGAKFQWVQSNAATFEIYHL